VAEVAFTGNSGEWSYYRNFIRPVIIKRLRARGYLGLTRDGTVRLHFTGKELRVFLDAHRIPVGKRRDAEIPPPIRRKPALLRAFIRGFYHAEGLIYRRYSKAYKGHARLHNRLLVIQFRTKLRTLTMQVRQAIMGFGVATTKLSEANGVFTFRITNQREIKKFLRIITPRFKLVPRTVYLNRQYGGNSGPVAQPG